MSITTLQGLVQIEVIDRCCTGNKDNITKEKIRRKIHNILNSYEYCTLGKTSDDRGRKYDYNKHGYSYMFLVYSSSSWKFIKYYEAHFLELYISKLQNQKEGSAGRINKKAPIHYLYICTKERKT